ncbi:reverse transcriptase domain-containing protein [Tanacetum coccineum]
MIDAATRALIAQGVVDALAEQEIQKNTNLNGDGSQGSGSGITRPVHPTREFTYSDFLKCQPVNFKGTERVVGLTQWFERTETVFHISNCAVENQVKFATYTLLGAALTWWNSHVKTVGHDAAYGMPWKTLMKMMTVKYYPRSEIKKMFPEESDEVEKYFRGLPDMIQGNVMSARPNTMQEAIELANDLIDQKNVAQDYAAGTSERKGTITCYECGNQGHYKSDCPKLENRNHGNQAEGIEARGMVYAFGGGETYQDLDDIEDDINA